MIMEGAADVMKKAILRAEKLDPDKEAIIYYSRLLNKMSLITL